METNNLRTNNIMSRIMVNKDPIKMLHWIKLAWGPRSPLSSFWGDHMLCVHIVPDPSSVFTSALCPFVWLALVCCLLAKYCKLLPAPFWPLVGGVWSNLIGCVLSYLALGSSLPPNRCVVCWTSAFVWGGA